MKNYLWESTVELPEFPALDKNIETDVLIIGGGLAGILCAYFMQREGIDCVLAEGATVGSGTTKGTTAVITAQHGHIYSKLIKKHGREKAAGYLAANLEAVMKYRKLAEKFDCDFEIRSSYLYSMTDRKSMKEEAEVVKALGFPAEYAEEIDLPLDIAAAVRFPAMAQFHPLKFAAAISRELKIYENTFVEKIDRTTAHTLNGSIKAKKIVIASHYPFINTHGLYPLKLYQKRSFVLALENAPQFCGTYADAAGNGMYIRNYNDMLIIGGGDYRTGTKDEGFKTVRQFVESKFPEAREKYAWAAQDCMSLDDVPYIGKYGKLIEGIYVISGFNEWGMTSSMVAAEIISDMICGRENCYAHIFAPDRNMISMQLFANIGETMLNFVTPTTKRCPHMGCALKENREEHTWDCPCHGSRFDEYGRLIDNPAMHDARV